MNIFCVLLLFLFFLQVMCSIYIRNTLIIGHAIKRKANYVNRGFRDQIRIEYFI